MAGPVTVRDLGLAFTRALAPAGQPDHKTWGSLPVGALPPLDLVLVIDEQGKWLSVAPLREDTTSPLLKLARQAHALLRSGFFAIQGTTPTAGRQVLRLSAELSDVPQEGNGGPVALSFSFAGGKGKASFTQSSGRRVDLRVELLRTEASPAGGKKAP
jgi:hypothetical protein